MAGKPPKLESRHISCLLDCRQAGHLNGSLNRDTLWSAGGSQSGYRTSTVLYLFGLGCLTHPLVRGAEPGELRLNKFVVVLTDTGLAALHEAVPNHPLLNTLSTNRSRIRRVV